MASGGTVPSALNLNSDLNLNVGGVVYNTTLKTITRDPNSTLGRMFIAKLKIPKDPKGNYFIDRDGSFFQYVLNFLLKGELCLPLCFDEFEQLLFEAVYYQVGGLIEAIGNQISSVRRRKIPQPSDDLDVIKVDDKGDKLFLTDQGQRGLIKKLFAEFMKTSKANEGIVKPDIIKVYIFDLLYRHGFQLEGCDVQGNNHYYIFARKNKL